MAGGCKWEPEETREDPDNLIASVTPDPISCQAHKARSSGDSRGAFTQGPGERPTDQEGVILFVLTGVVVVLALNGAIRLGRLAWTRWHRAHP